MADWKDIVDSATKRHSETEAQEQAAIKAGTERAERFISDKGFPAFTEFAAHLEAKGYSAKVTRSPMKVRLRVGEGAGPDQRVFDVTIIANVSPHRVWPKYEEEWDDRKTGKTYRTVDGVIRQGTQNYSVEDVTKEEILTFVAGKFSEALRLRGG